IRLLADRQILQIHREAEELKVGMGERDLVAFEALVHSTFHPAPQRLVPEKGRDEEKEQKADEGSRDPEGRLRGSPAQPSSKGARPRWPALRAVLGRGRGPLGRPMRVLRHEKPFRKRCASLTRRARAYSSLAQREEK